MADELEARRAADIRNKDFQWAGQESAYQNQADQYRRDAGDWRNMKAPIPIYQNADQTRGAQVDALGALRDAANGNGPSQARILMNQGNDRVAAAQLAAQAGAHGSLGRSMATQQAAQNAGIGGAANVNSAGALSAQEQETARNLYVSRTNSLRNMDQARAQYDAGLGLQQKELGLRGELAFEGMRKGMYDTQLNAQMAKQGINQGDWIAQMRTDQAAKDRDSRLGVGIISSGAGVAGKMTTL